MKITARVKFPGGSGGGGTLYRVRQYNDPVMLAMGYDINLIAPETLSNFEYVQLLIPGLGTGSVSTFCTIQRADIDRLIALQDAEAGVTVERKMNWLVYPGSYERPYWGGDWRTAAEIRWGVLVFGNQLVKVDRIELMKVKEPNGPKDKIMRMGRLVTFGKADWGKTFATDPHLIQRATAVRGHDNFHNEFPRGEIFSPLWSPVDFDLKPVGSAPAFRREYWAYMDTLTTV